MIRVSCLLVLAALTLSACGDDHGPPLVDASAQLASDGAVPPANELLSDKIRALTPVVSSDDATQLAADNLAFGVDLYAHWRRERSHDVERRGQRHALERDGL